MDKDRCFYLGRVSKLHGYKGELTLFLDVDDPTRYEKLGSVFVELNGQLVPFFIASFRPGNNNQFYCRFENIDSQERAEQLLGKDLYLPIEMLPKLSGNDFYFHEVIGFSLIEKEKGMIGTIESIIDHGASPIFQVMNPDGKEILLPYLKPFIVRLDRAQKELHYAAPEGLIDLYLQDNHVNDEDE